MVNTRPARRVKKVYSKKLSPPSPPYRPKARSCGLNWSRPEKNAGLALALLTECAPNPDCLGDDEWRVIRAEIEQMKAERDAAVEKIREWEKFDTYLLIHNLMPPEKWCDQKED